MTLEPKNSLQAQLGAPEKKLVTPLLLSRKNYKYSGKTFIQTSKKKMTWPPTESTNMERNKAQMFDYPCNYVVSKQPIGEGSYSSVFECKNIKTNIHYAAKRYTKKLVFGLETMLQNEFNVLKTISLDHPNLLSLVDYFETENYIYLVTNLAKGGDLFNQIETQGRISEHDTAIIINELVDTIRYLHSHNIIHRDIKAENILLRSNNENRIILADFGLARFYHGKLYDKCGTLSYLAPEILDGKGYGFEVDMWAVGVLTYFLLCGYMPFDCETDEETKHAIQTIDYLFDPPEYWDHISNSAKDFIRRCFSRMSANEALQHDFLVGTISSSGEASKTISSLSTRTATSLSPSMSEVSLNASSVSIYAKLKESLQALSQEQRSTSSASLDRLKGALCESPSVISKFNSPNQSTNVSRAQSVDKMAMTASINAQTNGGEKTIFFL